MKKTMNDIASGVSSKSDSVEKKLEELGIDLSSIRFGTNSSVQTAHITDAQEYIIVPNNSTLVNNEGYITKSTHDKMVYVLAHEMAGTKNGASEAFAGTSALFNTLESSKYKNNGNNINERFEYWYEQNSKWGLDIETSNTRDSEILQLAGNILDFTLSGTRAFDSTVQYWVGNWTYLNDLYGSTYASENCYSRFSTTYLETSMYE